MNKILAHGLIAAAAVVVAIASPAQAQLRCGWTRTVYNEGERPNDIKFEGVPYGDQNRYCKPDTMFFFGNWNDGPMMAEIQPRGGETYFWQFGDFGGGGREGVANSWNEAMYEMPSFLANPDHFEDHSDWVD